MSGIYLYIQSGLLALSSLFIFISYGAGSWWNNTHAEYDMKFTLWQLCTTYTTHDNCVSIKDDYLESVILTLRACMGIVVICLVVLLLLYGIWFIMQRRDATTQDHLLHARTVILALLALFTVVSLAHSHHCPPCYSVGQFKMAATVSWAWYLSLVSLMMLSVPLLMHCGMEVSNWREAKS